MQIETLKVGYLKTNCYFLIKNQKCIIVDPGEDANKIKEKIQKLQLTPIHILITHHHFDHVSALKEIVETYHIQKIDYHDYINDEKSYEFDEFKFQIISTSGHAKDCVTYYFKEEKVMITGDFLFMETVGRWDLETSSEEEMMRSIDKISTYTDDIKVYPGHGRETTLGHEKTSNPYFYNN